MIVPDGIEPVEEWRTWTFDGKVLRSLTNNTPWNPGEPLKADCQGGTRGEWRWQFVRYGMSLAMAQKHAERHNEHVQRTAAFSVSFTASVASSESYMSYPSVEPPAGFGYVAVRVIHDTPHEACSCGIYAARTPDDVPAGDVLGKVKMWGKIVPGTKGSRAEYAYPSELHVPPALADDPGILAYGVPVVVTDSEKVGGKSGFTFSMTTAGSFGASMAQASANFATLSLTPIERRTQTFWMAVRIFLALAGAVTLLLGALFHAHPVRTGLWVGLTFFFLVLAADVLALTVGRRWPA